MPTFIESPRFPEDISRNSRGGPMFNTQILQVDSGAIIRNSLWAYPEYHYDVSYGIRTKGQLYTLLEFFQNMDGRACGFRYKDWMDYKSRSVTATPTSLDVWFATGDGTTASFQLKKAYVSGAYSKARLIYKPVNGTIKLSVAGTDKTESTHFTVDYTTGIITFTGGNIPTAGQEIRAGFEFDVPVCFASDRLDINLDHFNAGTAQVPLIELKFGTT